jgi:hypothetical protein
MGGDAAVVDELAFLRIEPHGLAEVIDRAVEIALAAIGDAAVVVGVGHVARRILVGLDHRVAAANRLVGREGFALVQAELPVLLRLGRLRRLLCGLSRLRLRRLGSLRRLGLRLRRLCRGLRGLARAGDGRLRLRGGLR